MPGAVSRIKAPQQGASSVPWQLPAYAFGSVRRSRGSHFHSIDSSASSCSVPSSCFPTVDVMKVTYLCMLQSACLMTEGLASQPQHCSLRRCGLHVLDSMLMGRQGPYQYGPACAFRAAMSRMAVRTVSSSNTSPVSALLNAATTC